MFFDIDIKDPASAAAFNEKGETLSYGQLAQFSRVFYEQTGHRTLLFILCRNCFGALLGYIACLSCGIVPLLLDAGLDKELLQNLIDTYQPEYLWVPSGTEVSYPACFGAEDYVLLKTGYDACKLHPDLGLLLTTSGSTGTAKLVRLSYAAILANAQSILNYLELDYKERPVTSLPMSYTYGLSVINSHLLAGAAILMTDRSLFEHEFWEFFTEQKASSLAGVPFTYEMLKKLRFFRMQLPSLKTMTQAGGRLSPELHREFAAFAREKGIRFFVMYGQTEATARMAYLPYEKKKEKCGSIGIAIPGGKLSLIGEDGREVNEPDTIGEIVYEGINVMMGYSACPADLAKGDELHGRLLTGDIAKYDKDGYYYIAGRKKRFLKIYGKRVNPDECEKLLKEAFAIDCACSGRDDLLGIFLTDKALAGTCCEYLSQKLGLPSTAFKARDVAQIPRNEAGKIQYKDLKL